MFAPHPRGALAGPPSPPSWRSYCCQRPASHRTSTCARVGGARRTRRTGTRASRSTRVADLLEPDDARPRRSAR